jgi:hypothetical protein
MNNFPEIDLDFQRGIREDLILLTHKKWEWDATMTGTIATYIIRLVLIYSYHYDYFHHAHYTKHE